MVPLYKEILAAIEKFTLRDLPGGPVVKNLPANAGETGSTPGPGRFHMPKGNEAYEPQPLSPRALEPRAPRQEKPLKREDRTPRLESSPHSPQ